MYRFLPRTMTGLVSLGCLLAAMPLLAALLLAGGALDRLTTHTEELVDNGVLLARLGTQLRDQVRDLERNAEQYLAINDEALLAVINGRQDDAMATVRRIEQRGPHSEALQLHQMLADARRAWAASLNGTMEPADAVAQFRALGPAADSIIASARATIEQQMGEIGQATTASHTVMALSALALFPLTALLTLAFSVAVTRPLQAMNRGIVALGHGRYETPIAIAYPREMQQLGERLDWLRQRSAALEAEKDRFLRHVSHELKTPLATLKEGSSLLRDHSLGPLSPQQHEVAQILGDASTELGALIRNLLSYAEWRQEERRPALAWFDAGAMISEVVQAQQLLLSRKRLSVELEVHSPRLYGQRSRLRVALDNLLGNAIKHAPEGSAIAIHAGMAGDRCELIVRDRGRGVPDGERQHIFEPFVRGTEPEESAVRGTGIGLSIVRETARAHEGVVEVDDAKPGARFRMVWPCGAADGP